MTKEFSSHTSSGGYDQLARYVGARTVPRHQISSVPLRLIEKAWHFGYGDKPHLFSHLSHGYRFEDRLAEERAFWRALLFRTDIVHTLYGDWMLDMLLRRRGLIRAGLVATFHLPAEETADRFERVQRNALRNLDGAVVLSTNQLRAYAEWLGPEKVVFVPHGIDTQVFSPGLPNRGKRARFVFVGAMLRDFATAHLVIDRCRCAGVDAEFQILIPSNAAPYFTGCTNANIMNRISEPDLVALYRSADALFLPLLDSTANNAILEALACGVPVITSRVGGVPDYVDDSCGWLLPAGDADAAFEQVRMIAADREAAWAKREQARQKAESFAWPVVARTLTAAYERLATTGKFAPERSQQPRMAQGGLPLHPLPH
jgi:glycosyltransferase involved in cell wall biosynthesis